MLTLFHTVITHTHNTSLALVAIVVSIVAAITGLALMNNIRTLPESRRKAVIVMASFLLGGGIWSMHFLAMLSISFPVPIHYDLLQTLGSGLIAVLVVGFALLLLHFRQRTQRILNSAGLCLGVGIVSMHLVGMLGMRGVIPNFNMVSVTVASLLALFMGVAAIRVSYGSRSRVNIVKGGVMFGLAVVVVHYTAMIGTQFSVDPNYEALTISLNQGSLAIAVSVAGFVIGGTFLLAASTFVPLPGSTSEYAAVDAVGAPQGVFANTEHASGTSVQSHQTPTNQSTAERLPEHSQHPVAAHVASGVASGDFAKAVLKPDTSSHLNSPDNVQQGVELAGEPSVAKAPSERLQDQLAVSDLQHTVDVASEPTLTIKIPYERLKQILFVDSGDVGAIRADGRYTQLYTRDGVKFCPWSITEAENRLIGARFYRSHRSYLINIMAVAGFEKHRDSGVCRFEGFTQLTQVPVSRARVNELTEELGV